MARAHKVQEVAVVYRGRAKACPEFPVRDSAGAARYIWGVIGDQPVEKFGVLLLDGRHRAIGLQVVSVGTLTASLVHPREVFRGAIMKGCAAMILAHNHPSGEPSPSAEDRTITKRLREAGEILGIAVIDHIIVASPTVYCSAKEEGWI